MELVLDICQGIGVACAVGVSPFLPAALVCALAAANLGVDFDHTKFAWLESPVTILTLVLALALFVFGERRRLPALDRALAPTLWALGPVLGALLFAATLDDRHSTWWYGIPAGLLCAVLAVVAVSSLLGRVRKRLDPEAASALPIYAEGVGLGVAGLSVLAPPLGLVALLFVVALLVTGRRREQKTYAGLRVLR